MSTTQSTDAERVEVPEQYLDRFVAEAGVYTAAAAGDYQQCATWDRDRDRDEELLAHLRARIGQRDELVAAQGNGCVVTLDTFREIADGAVEQARQEVHELVLAYAEEDTDARQIGCRTRELDAFETWVSRTLAGCEEGGR